MPVYLVSGAWPFESSGLSFHVIIDQRGRLRDSSMERDVADRVGRDEIVLNLDVPDDTLERAASRVDGQPITWAYCTHVSYDCGWPQ